MFNPWKVGMMGRLALATVCFCAISMAQPAKYKVGRAPTEEEIKAWSISMMPDGTGLPEGKGTAVEGKEVYSRRCSECHGNELQGGDAEALGGGQGTLATPKPLKTVGSYWSHATTLIDYVNRAMPFDTPGMLSNDQLYAVTAFVLFKNGIIAETDEMNAETLPKVKMPNADGFVKDTRPDVGSAASK